MGALRAMREELLDGRARRRAPRRAAPGHGARRLPRGRPLPRAAEAGRAAATPRRPEHRRRARRHQRASARRGHAAAAGDPAELDARRDARRGRRRQHRGRRARPRRRAAPRSHSRSCPSCRAGESGSRCRPRTSRPIGAARCATSSRASCASPRPDRAPALRDRRPPGARALPRETGATLGADARPARRLLAAAPASARASRIASCSRRHATALARYHERLSAAALAARSGSSARSPSSLGPHQVRGRVDRVDRLAAGGEDGAPTS